MIGSIQTHDISRVPDLLLVLGTSLKVHGLKRLVKELARAVHSLPVTAARPNGGKGRVVFVNKTEPQGSEWKGVFDFWVKGECDAWVDKVEEEWRRVKKSDWEMQTTLDGMAVVKPVQQVAAVKKSLKVLQGQLKVVLTSSRGLQLMSCSRSCSSRRRTCPTNKASSACPRRSSASTIASQSFHSFPQHHVFPRRPSSDL